MLHQQNHQKCSIIIKMKIINKLFVFAVLWCSTLGATIPADFKTCKLSDVTPSSECLKLAIQDALPKMKNGFPDLKIGELEPLFVDNATIGEGDGAINVARNYKNFKIHGVSHSVVDNVGANIADDKNTWTMDIKAHAPEYRFEADYALNGRVLLLPIVDVGQCNVTGINITVDVSISGKIFEKKGKEYMKATEVDVILAPERVTYYFGNLFNNNKALGDQINTLLNDDWKEIFDDVKDSYEKLLGKVFLNYINSFFTKVPFEELFPK